MSPEGDLITTEYKYPLKLKSIHLHNTLTDWYLYQKTLSTAASISFSAKCDSLTYGISGPNIRRYACLVSGNAVNKKFVYPIRKFALRRLRSDLLNPNFGSQKSALL